MRRDLSSLLGDAGDDTITGGGAPDEIHGGDGVDKISGNDGDDTIYGELGADIMCGDAGNDSISDGDGDYENPAYDKLWDTDAATAACLDPSSRTGGGGFTTKPGCSSYTLLVAPACP